MVTDDFIRARLNQVIEPAPRTGRVGHAHAVGSDRGVAGTDVCAR